MPNPTTVGDIEARWRPLSEQETINATALLGDAWELLLSRRSGLEEALSRDAVSMGTVVRIVAAMVIRVMRNPDGLLQEAIDDYSYRRDSLVSSGVLHVTEAELADLTERDTGRRHSVRLVVYGDA